MRYILGLSTVWYRGRANLVGAGSADECSESYAHPELSRGGKCVRVKNWQKDAQPEGTETVSGMRDLPEAGQDADATEVLPATHPFPVTDENPTTGAASAGSGAGWFGGAGDAGRRGAGPAWADARTGSRPSPEVAGTRFPEQRGNADADRTDIPGRRAGLERTGQDRDPLVRGRITWGTRPSATAPGGAGTGGAAPSRTNPNGTGPAGSASGGVHPAPSAPSRVSGGPRQAYAASASANGPHPAGVSGEGAHSAPPGPVPAQRDGVRPSPAGPSGPTPRHAAPRPAGIPAADPVTGRTGVVPPVADRTEVLPPVADRTEVLPPVTGRTGVVPPVADRTEVLPPVADRTEILPPAPRTRAFPASASASVPPAASVPGPATASLRDPWQDAPDSLDAPAGEAADHTHDPHEVTVQLDAVQLGDGVLRRADGPRHATKGPEGSDGPVFVDASGRRSRLYRRLGIAVGVACAVYAVVIVSTLLSGNSNAPWLPVDGQQEGKPAGQCIRDRA